MGPLLLNYVFFFSRFVCFLRFICLNLKLNKKKYNNVKNIYSRTAVTRTLMARLPRLTRS